jgi:intraflagellar transport protein 22
LISFDQAEIPNIDDKLKNLAVMSIKVVIAGPKGSGKSTIGNYIGGNRESLVTERYSPTAGVRILEMESNGTNVELWDASGDHAYEACWKAIMNEADGVLLVYNPDAPSQDQQIMDWFEFFVRKNGLSDEQCMVFAHRSNPSTSNDKFRPPPLFSRVNAALTTAQSGPDVKSMFDNFLKEIIGIKQRK